ncbi:hypothetical protein M885DRAFT_613974 [Pelagophyceae sp. CCMP2097]|nr:hypothetical protein M885DRAFT_613974 [Pelagophyceae sp. CCMP2097]
MTEAKKAAAGLDKVTDYVETQELDATQTHGAMDALAGVVVQQTEAERQRELELAAVTVKPEDLSAIMTELEVSKELADRTLRIHGGDLVAALRALVSS